MVVAAHEYLLAVLVHQHDAVVLVHALSVGVSPDDDTDGIVRAGLALEDILVRGRGHVRDVAHLGVFQRERNEVGCLPLVPREVEALFGVVGSHRTEGVGVVCHEARHGNPRVGRFGRLTGCIGRVCH